MYAPFFGLQQEAFAIAPDPRFLHLSAMHREALAHLLYGLQGGGGFVLLTGEIGTGKTTVCRCFLEQIPSGHHVAYVYNPKLTVIELLQTICQEFGLGLPEPAPASVKPYVDVLNQHLLRTHAAGEHNLLVIDEAQGLSADLLEQLRLLTNLETNERKLLQIVLIGQPELRLMLARPELEQLAQRVIARVHLGPLAEAETEDYINHRLAVAGLAGELPFDRRALALVQRLSGGVPRRINLLCQRALLGAYALGTRQIGPRIVRQAAREAFGDNAPKPQRAVLFAVVSVALLGMAGATVGWWQTQPQRSRTATAPAAPSSSASSALPMPVELRPYADERSAWSALAADWSLDLSQGDEPCAAARRQQLACHEGTGDPALLRQLQRPVLLQLPPGAPALLRALGTSEAVLAGAGGDQRVPLATLQQAWKGSFITLWRPPPGWAAAGDRTSGDAANWVLDRLVTLQGEARAGSARSSRDEMLRQRVFAFQLSQGLALDGVAGPITLMQLNRASGIDEPRLRREP